MAETTPYTNLLVPTDGSKRARRAVEHAIGLVRGTEATIPALYVMDMGDADFVAVPGDIAETRQRLERKGREYTDEIADLVESAGLESVSVVRTGIAPEEIVDYAEEEGIDLIAMGKRGRSDSDKPLFGSITQRVDGLSSVPVHVV